MKVAELKSQLKERGLETKGNKSVLIERLQEAVNAEALEGDEEEENGDGDEILEDVKEDEVEEDEVSEIMCLFVTATYKIRSV